MKREFSKKRDSQPSSKDTPNKKSEFPSDKKRSFGKPNHPSTGYKKADNRTSDFKKKDFGKPRAGSADRPYRATEMEGDERKWGPQRKDNNRSTSYKEDRSGRSAFEQKKPYIRSRDDKKPFRSEGRKSNKTSDGKELGVENNFENKHPKKPYSSQEGGVKPPRKTYPSKGNKEALPPKGQQPTSIDAKPIEAPMTLNKYIAHSGECSRRDAAELVKQGKVRVNGELVLEPGHRVSPGDIVSLSGKKMTPQKNLVYVLLNKPKGYITTTEDPQERKTVMELVANSGVDRLYPVGRLDRNTTGLLLLTNDGALAHRLSHPSYNIRKVYHVTLDKNLSKADYEKIFKGVELEDGIAQVDEIAYLETRHEIGLEIHSGRNRIVRRIFESLGYVVEKLDRVTYAGLTKKNLPRGKWRFLDEKEVIYLKHFNKQ